MNEIKTEILYHLSILQFLRSDQVDTDRLEKCINSILGNDTFEILDNEEERNQISVCENKIMKIAYLRDTDMKKNNNNKVISNKKQYKFDNVFEKDNYSSMVDEMIDFLYKRIELGINSSVLIFGLSSSGKTTLSSSLINKLNCDTYSLSCVYNNNRFVYKRGVRIPVKNDDEEYVFKATLDNLMKILELFSIKKNNGVNLNSSRAHVILKCYFPNKTVIDLIDLCGNEKCMSNDEVTRIETKYINSSLYNISSFLRNPKFKDNKCLLLNIIKKSSNIILNLLLHDNSMSKASSLLGILKNVL